MTMALRDIIVSWKKNLQEFDCIAKHEICLSTYYKQKTFICQIQYRRCLKKRYMRNVQDLFQTFQQIQSRDQTLIINSFLFPGGKSQKSLCKEILPSNSVCQKVILFQNESYQSQKGSCYVEFSSNTILFQRKLTNIEMVQVSLISLALLGFTSALYITNHCE